MLQEIDGHDWHEVLLKSEKDPVLREMVEGAFVYWKLKHAEAKVDPNNWAEVLKQMITKMEIDGKGLIPIHILKDRK